MEKNLDIMKPHSKHNYIILSYQSLGPSLYQGFTVFSNQNNCRVLKFLA